MTSFREIIRLDLTDISIYKGIFCLDFGARVLSKYSESLKKFSQYSLDIQCPFRFILGEKIILASYDISKRFQENLDDKMGNSVFDKLLDERISPLLPLKVIDCICNPLGDIKIIFSNDVILETFIDASLEVEHYRLADETKDFTQDLIFSKDEESFAEKSKNYVWLEAHKPRNL
ncbi:hypothetical protein [Helicobacter sp. 11S02596-1]|uniref:hypothetical protein n=1 Tax=Helicobacter sp. 11S02596-1 TaxID=1476194 RepID=UPI000BA5097D|nr:hypothetical protein [Helicobacter sp. 11S02596-1]PAF44756.1 hypothetical protein BJI48_01850 [Helicobacter sp. 11S02596-1]